MTFQSILRTSSPYWYSLTSLKAIPRPLNAEWYSPAKIWWERALVLISILRTFLRRSDALVLESIVKDYLRNNDCVEYLRDDVLCSNILGLSLICQADTVAEHFIADCAHILRNHIASPLDEGIGLGRH